MATVPMPESTKMVSSVSSPLDNSPTEAAGLVNEHKAPAMTPTVVTVAAARPQQIEVAAVSSNGYSSHTFGEIAEVEVRTDDGDRIVDGASALADGLVGDDGSVTKCICGFFHDDGYMVCCDRCSVWQHVDCIRTGKKLPETYFCHICEPRTLNVERAKAIQHKKHLALERKRKREEVRALEKLRKQTALSSSPDKPASKDYDERRDNVPSDYESSDSDDSQCSTPPEDYTPDLPDFSTAGCVDIQHDHVPATLLANPSKIKPREWKQRVLDQVQPAGRIELLMSDNLEEIGIVRSEGDDMSSKDVWNNTLSPWTSHFDLVLCNEYGADLAGVLRETLMDCAMPKTEGLASSSNEATCDGVSQDRQPCAAAISGSSNSSPECPVLCAVKDVHPHRQGLVAKAPITSGTLVIEYKGSISRKVSFDMTVPDHAWVDRPLPYVLYYSDFEDSGLVVDARSIGNMARYIRRSCSPNAKVRHFVAGGALHVGIYSARDISVNEEITIDLDYPLEKCNFPVECACRHLDGGPPCRFQQLSAQCLARQQHKRRCAGLPHRDRLLCLLEDHILRQHEVYMQNLDQQADCGKGVRGKSKSRQRGRPCRQDDGSDAKYQKRSDYSCAAGATPKEVLSPDEMDKDIWDSRKRTHPDEDGIGRKRRRIGPQDFDETSNQSLEDIDNQGEDGSSLKKPSREDRKMEAILKQFMRLEKTGPSRRRSISDDMPPRGKKLTISTPTTPTVPAPKIEKPKTPGSVKSRRVSRSSNITSAKRPGPQKKRTSQSNPDTPSFVPSPDNSSSGSFSCGASTPLLIAAEAALEEENSTNVGVAALLQLAQFDITSRPAPVVMPVSEHPSAPASVMVTSPIAAASPAVAALTPVVSPGPSGQQGNSATPRLPLKKLTAKSWAQQDVKPSTLDLQPASESTTPLETSPDASACTLASAVKSADVVKPQSQSTPLTPAFSPVVGSAKKRWLQTHHQAMASPLVQPLQAPDTPVTVPSKPGSPRGDLSLEAALEASPPDLREPVESPSPIQEELPVVQQDSLDEDVTMEEEEMEEEMDVDASEQQEKNSENTDTSPTVTAAATPVTSSGSENVVSAVSPVEQPEPETGELSEEDVKSEVGPSTPIPSSPGESDVFQTGNTTASTPVKQVSMYEDLSPVSDMAASPLFSHKAEKVQAAVSDGEAAARQSLVEQDSSEIGDSDAADTDNSGTRRPAAPGQMLFSHSPLTSPRISPALVNQPGVVGSQNRGSVSEAQSPGSSTVDLRRSSSRSSLSDPRSRNSLDSPGTPSPSKPVPQPSVNAPPPAALVPLPATKKKVSLSEYRRRTQEVRQPASAGAVGSGARSPPWSRGNSTPVSPMLPQSPLSTPPPLPEDAMPMVISPPPPPASCASPAEIDLLAAPPPLFLSSAQTAVTGLTSATAACAPSALHTASKPAPVYEPVSPDMNMESPPDTDIYGRSVSSHSLSSSCRDADVRWSSDRQGGLPGLKVSPLSDADDELSTDPPMARPMDHAAFTCLSAVGATASRPSTVAVAGPSSLPQPKSFEQRRRKALQSAHNQVGEFVNRGAVAAGAPVAIIHGGGVVPVAAAGVSGHPAAGFVAGRPAVGVSPPVGSALVRDPRQSADPRQAAGAVAGPVGRSGQLAHDPRHAPQYAQGGGGGQSMLHQLHHQRHHLMSHVSGAQPSQPGLSPGSGVQQHGAVQLHRHTAASSGQPAIAPGSAAAAAAARRGQPLLQTPGQQQTQQQSQQQPQQQQQFQYQSHGYFHG